MENINNIIKRQHLASVYIPQTAPLPGVGMLVSMGAAVVTVGLLVRKATQAFFDPNHTYQSGLMEGGKLKMRTISHMDDAKDLGIILLNNIANVATLGILNYCIISRNQVLPEKHVRNLVVKVPTTDL